MRNLLAGSPLNQEGALQPAGARDEFLQLQQQQEHVIYATQDHCNPKIKKALHQNWVVQEPLAVHSKALSGSLGVSAQLAAAPQAEQAVEQ